MCNDTIMKKEFNMIAIKRTFADFFGEVKKVSYIGPYFAEEGEHICEVTKRYDMRKQLNVNGFPVTKWEVVEWDESYRILK